MAEIKKSHLALGCLAWAALASLPPELLGLWKGWDSMSPESYISDFIWMPVAVYATLKILQALGPLFGLASLPSKSAASALPSALGVELLLSLRFCGVVLACLLPAFICLSLFGVATLPATATLLAISLLGLILPALWFLKRLAAPALVLWQGLNASEALEASAKLCQGKLKSVIIPLLLWNLLAQALELLGLASEPLNLVILPLSLLISTAALGRAYAKLTL